MTVENFENLLSEYRHRKPFRVFTVELFGGERIEVDFPDALVVRNGVAVFITPGGIPKLFEHESVNQFIIAPLGSISQ